MTYEEILELYRSGTGNATQAIREEYRHINFALQHIYRTLDIPEVFKGPTTLATVKDQDWVTTPSDLGSVSWIQNEKTGTKLKREPGGMAGRSKFFEAAQTRPPINTLDSVHFYIRRAGKIFLRDTPNAIGNLTIDYKVLPAAVTSSDLASSPALPVQYHPTIPDVAIGYYYKFHPMPHPETMIPMQGYGDERIKLALAAVLVDERDPEAEEELDQSTVIRQPGYEMGL